MEQYKENIKRHKPKLETATEVGMAEFAADDGFPKKSNPAVRGKIGGNMVKKMIQTEENKMAHDGKK